ncbi:MAG: hypothetical protein GXX96_19030 [Planctomycetaceae bacterium]|nr:hypothetical protein [Planctomycetaceae bacterium]
MKRTLLLLMLDVALCIPCLAAEKDAPALRAGAAADVTPNELHKPDGKQAEKSPWPKSERYEKQILAFEAADKTSPPPQNGILFTGASNIVGWKTLAEDFPGLPVINRGFGGSHIADCTFYADRIVIPYKPRVIVFRTGGNDINAGKTPEEVAADFQAFAEKVHGALPETRIVFWSMTPSVKRLAGWEREKKGNELIRAYIAGGKNMVYLDTVDATLGPDGKPRAELYTDGLHFNREAFKMFAKIIRPCLE